jgi:hypothetical protein
MRSAAVLLSVMVLARAGQRAMAQEMPFDAMGETKLSFNPSADPLGNIDSYKMLAQADIEGQWSKDDGKNATEKMNELLSFLSVIHVDVKLVGFDGDGNYGLKVSPPRMPPPCISTRNGSRVCGGSHASSAPTRSPQSFPAPLTRSGAQVDEEDFMRYFDAMLEEYEKEAGVLKAESGKAHTLPIKREFFFRVMKAKKALNEDISTKVRSWLLTENREATTSRGGGLVPVGIVDEVAPVRPRPPPPAPPALPAPAPALRPGHASPFALRAPARPPRAGAGA